MGSSKNTYKVYFFLIFVLCLSVFLFCIISPPRSLERGGLDHAFTGSELSNLFGRNVSTAAIGLVNVAWRLLVYGSLGLWGLHLSFKAGLKNILNNDIKQPKSVIITVLAGAIMGAFFIGYDVILSQVFFRHVLMYPSSTIPASIFASVAEGIGCQILNMFSVAFLMWIFSKAIKNEGNRNGIFWLAAVLCAVIFAIRHIESTMIWYSSHVSIFNLLLEDYLIIIGLYAPLSLICTYFLRKYGLLSAITIHFICDIMWRVGWAYIQFGDIIIR